MLNGITWYSLLFILKSDQASYDQSGLGNS